MLCVDDTADADVRSVGSDAASIGSLQSQPSSPSKDKDPAGGVKKPSVQLRARRYSLEEDAAVSLQAIVRGTLTRRQSLTKPPHTPSSSSSPGPSVSGGNVSPPASPISKPIATTSSASLHGEPHRAATKLVSRDGQGRWEAAIAASHPLPTHSSRPPGGNSSIVSATSSGQWEQQQQWGEEVKEGGGGGDQGVWPARSSLSQSPSHSPSPSHEWSWSPASGRRR